MRKFRFFGRAGSLGTGLTALFLLLRCTVTPRDYSLLGIGDNVGTAGTGGSAGSGGSGGSAGGSAGSGGGASGSGAGGSAGQGGMSGMAGMSSQDAGPTIEPIPCTVPDAGDAGRDASAPGSDAGNVGTDAGSGDPVCECVDGFFRAVDADGDGVGSRACTIAPGLDCDDGDDTVTHNACGGCSDLPNAVGTDCLECGAYACDGPDAVVCASKPDPVADPDCRCVDGVIAARDTDGDGAGTRLCEANPGLDCNDGDSGYITNDCGGCEAQPGALGSLCNQCGTYTCSGTAIVCSPQTGAAGQQCLNASTRQTCIGSGFWGNNMICANACYQGNCEECLPGAYRCVNYGGGSYQLEECRADATNGVRWSSAESCAPGQTCDAVNGQCTGHLLLPHDRSFDLGLPKKGGLLWHELLNTASETDYG